MSRLATKDFVADDVDRMTRSLKGAVHDTAGRGVWFLEMFVRNRARLFVDQLPDGNNTE